MSPPGRETGDPGRLEAQAPRARPGHDSVEVVHLFQVQLDGLGEVGQSLIDRVPLAGHVDLQALGNVPVLFLVQRCGKGSRHVRHRCKIAAPVLPAGVRRHEVPRAPGAARH